MSEASRWEDYFREGERLLWEGSPVKHAGFSFALVFFSAFGVPFLVVGIGMMGAGVSGLFTSGGSWSKLGISVFIFFFGIPFATVGTALVFGPWYMLANAHKKIRYALSNHRAYIATRWWGRKLQTHDWRKSPMLELKEGKHASTVFFEEVTSGESTKRIGFENIADGRRVFDLIQQGREGAP